MMPSAPSATAFDVGRVGQHGDDQLHLFGDLFRRVRGGGSSGGQFGRRRLVVGADHDLVAGVEQVLGHRFAHDS